MAIPTPIAAEPLTPLPPPGESAPGPFAPETGTVEDLHGNGASPSRSLGINVHGKPWRASAP